MWFWFQLNGSIFRLVGLQFHPLELEMVILLRRCEFCLVFAHVIAICYFSLIYMFEPNLFLYMIARHGSFKTFTHNFGLWPLTLTTDFLATNATKCHSLSILYPISILFALCNSTRWGLQNLYTEFWSLTPLTFVLDFVFDIVHWLQNATPWPFLTQF